jgi:hypothetical protein
MSFGDDRIEAIRRQAEDLIQSLALTAEEEVFARRLAEEVFEQATKTYLALPEPALDRTRAVAAAAAVAYALVTTTGWADRTDTEFPPA